MFNLLRRSTKKKKNSNQEKSPKSARYSAGAPEERANGAGGGSDKSNAAGSIERYRSYGEWQREREREREQERKRQQDERRRGLPIHTNSGKTYRRAEIEEFDDLKDLEENENDYCDDADARSDESSLASAGRKTLFGGSGKSATNERCVYFRSNRVDGESDRQVGNKLNLAKTTAANNTALSDAADTAIAKEEYKEYEESCSAISSTGEGLVAATNSVKASSSFILPNETATLRTNDRTLGDLNVDKINKLSAEQNILDASHGDIHESNEDNRRFARSSAVRDDMVCHDCETLYCHDSSNEEAVWQRRILPFAKCKKYNKTDRFTNRSLIESDQCKIIQDTTNSAIASNSANGENVERAFNATASNENRIRNDNGNRHESDILPANEQIALANDTTNAAAIGAVKYRNFDNTNRTTKVQKNSEAKRQSRLSLTLGLNLKGARSKSITDVSTANTDSSSVTGYYSSSSSCSGRGQRKQSQLGKAFRNSFLRGRSKSSDTETPFEDDALKSVKVEKSLSGAGSKALRKSKEFLSDLFMARGRNNNRNRNPQTQTPTQTQTQKIPQTLTQKQQQQKLAQLQQPSSKDVRPFAPANAPTSVNNNSHQHHHSSRNSYNNSSPQVNPVAVMQNGQNNLVSTHLDVISDPLGWSTNSYQITMSNNNAKNVSRIDDDAERQRRSNSAGEQQLSVRVAPIEASARSRSADPQWCVSETGARKESKAFDGESVERRLNEAGNGECGIIREISVELKGSVKTAGTDNINAAQADDRQRESSIAGDPLRNTAIETSYRNVTNNINSEEYIVKDKEEGNGEEEACVQGSAVNRVIKSNQCKNDVTICSKASEAPHSAFPITTTTKTPSTSTNSANSEREACNLPSSPEALSPSVCPHSASMGQTSAKPSETAPSSRASTPGEYRETVLPDTLSGGRASECVADKPQIPILPKITVVDCSGSLNGEGQNVAGSPVEQEVFYDFENDLPPKRVCAGVEISAVSEDVDQLVNDIEEDEVFNDQEVPATIYQSKWPLRYNPTKLENVPEQEENEEEEELVESDEADSATDFDSDNVEADGDADIDIDVDVAKTEDAANLDIEFEGNQHFDSPERNALKSANTSDSNLSNSCHDSGISGIDSHCSSTSSSNSHRHSSSDNETHAARSTKSRSPPMQLHRNRQQQPQLMAHQRLPFVRDGNSTDCDETLLQYDDPEYVTDLDPNERLVCIESISLPDVVVESTTGASGVNASASSATSSGDHTFSKGSEQIININGATGNSIGNVHFIPIHVEGSDQATPKRRSVDDSVLGSGGGINKTFAHMNGLQQKSTIEITEDASELTYARVNGHSSNGNDEVVEKLRQELIEQKSRYNTQIGDAQKNVQNLQNKVGEMQAKIEKLEQELSTKAWNVERLQSELKAAQKDDDFVRKRLKLLEDEKVSLRHKYSENEDEFRRKYEELETQYNELEVKYKETKQLASNLQTQLATAQSEAEEWRKEVEKIRGELETQIAILKNALESSEAERKICQDKWQKEFEILRTQNRDREETVMTDCEWKLRQIQRQAKDKTDKIIHERELVTERAEQLQHELEERKQEVQSLKVYQAEVTSLRGVVTEQEQAIKSLMHQIDNIKSELHTAKTNLEEQMKAVKKIKNQCDNALCDKEREVVYRISEVRNQAAVFWEDKLYTEMTRLKTELESVYVDERREALDKLQAEHIEELRALTTRYTANEDELRTELNELQERFERKSDEFTEMRDKSDNTLLQMRMHLDRADREYQNAMCREEERRETLEANLRKEFQAEREEMEEKFRERLSQVKEEFAKELQLATEEMRQEKQKELEQQKVKLQAEKEQALQELTERHRKKLAAAEEQIKEIELQHQHDLKDLKAAYDTEKAAMDKRDISNTNEIEQLHRKCRCLTNLFEEMRMRYERRDPRPEDLREIDELRSRCESQERDLFDLTDRLREMQIQMTAMQAANGDAAKKVAKQVKKPPPKTIPTNCDVIYEDENEERESPPPQTSPLNNHVDDDDDEDDDADDDAKQDEEEESDDNEEADEDEVVEAAEQDLEKRKNGKNQSRCVNSNAKTANLIISSKEHFQKKNDTINEADESHMITAV
ncbi:uncharacterized protein LOC129235627 isoform X1 [Anastrepha obliqua]|uniref:uncharacterized protein LOC129235627 isoform X1 n=1 Tax=Anastrepha obliqua TaxID=95512 RepID=UPI00240A2DE7|nr:uncharacterized protein LOC129235627 isoform X1 [Anastrepha obliqua]XP_054725544.1 uncharacterized protein LOC129235627 isoform X1 [Anastrepha obliqua]XP_054725545.1 uncharacterized protein LOC129235627 isoform X1 [Anastrepha obliqua]